MATYRGRAVGVSAVGVGEVIVDAEAADGGQAAVAMLGALWAAAAGRVRVAACRLSAVAAAAAAGRVRVAGCRLSAVAVRRAGGGSLAIRARMRQAMAVSAAASVGPVSAVIVTASARVSYVQATVGPVAAVRMLLAARSRWAESLCHAYRGRAVSTARRAQAAAAVGRLRLTAAPVTTRIMVPDGWASWPMADGYLGRYLAVIRIMVGDAVTVDGGGVLMIGGRRVVRDDGQMIMVGAPEDWRIMLSRPLADLRSIIASMVEPDDATRAAALVRLRRRVATAVKGGSAVYNMQVQAGVRSALESDYALRSVVA